MSIDVKNPEADWKKYLIVFFITLFIFIFAIWLGNTLNSKKLDEIKSVQDQIALDTLDSETQYALLEELRCDDLENSILSRELGELARKLEYGEDKISGSEEDLEYLRSYYFLLEIKDFLLTRRAKEKCNLSVEPIIYFYTTKEECEDCDKLSLVLTTLREDYDILRVYSFDRDSKVSAVQALMSLYKIEGEFPALIISGKTYSGFKSIEEIKELIPELKEIDKEREKEEAKKAEIADEALEN